MKKKKHLPYILLIFFVLGCLAFSSTIVEPCRSGIVYLISPLWKRFSSIHSPLTSEEKVGTLEEENKELHRRLIAEMQAKSQLKKLEELSCSELQGEFSLRRQSHIKRLLKLEAHSLSARVIYRQPSSWNSTLWIDVGERDNRALDFPVVKANSPVLAGNNLIGVVDEVWERQSRVRLLSDSALVISVRAVRGNQQQREMLKLLDQLILELSLQGESLLSAEEREAFFEKCGFLKERLREGGGEKYLAKGELYGTGLPLWRRRSSVLKGIGFNYDFEDVEGPARELRSGRPYDRLIRGGDLVLIREGDLLVTTGMDGVFPPDLPVAIVSKVLTLKEGAASYAIEAELCSGEIGDLSTVTILPSLEFEF